MSLFNNSKDKDTKAKRYGEPCEGKINPQTNELPQTPYKPETEVNPEATGAPKADTRDGRLTKITIESPDGTTKVIEAHGVAMTCLRDLGDKYEGAVAVFGMLSPKEMIELWMQAKHKLVPELEETAIKNAAEKYSIKDLMGALKSVLEDM